VPKPAPLGGPCAGRLSEGPAGQRSDHLPVSQMTASGRLRLNHYSPAPGKTQPRSFQRDRGRRALTWTDTTPSELLRAPAQIGVQPLQSAAMVSPHTT
jgi:hypothetical protein